MCKIQYIIMAFILVSVSGYRHNNNNSSIKFDRRIEEIVGDVMKEYESTNNESNEISYIKYIIHPGTQKAINTR